MDGIVISRHVEGFFARRVVGDEDSWCGRMEGKVRGGGVAKSVSATT